MYKHIVVRFAVLLCLLLPLRAPAASFSEIFIFGDSLSDSGNISDATAGAIPGRPYFQGRFSNGVNYADRLAANLGLPLAPSRVGGSNFAFGGARTDSHPFAALGGLSVLQQLAAFTDALGNTDADAEALYIVFAGANNLQDAIATRNPETAAALVAKAIADIQFIIATLEAKGARTILVPNVPNLGVVPRVTELESVFPGISALARFLSVLFNAQLDTMLNTFPALNIIRFNTFARLQKVVAAPKAFGFTNVTSRCYTGDDLTFTGGGTVCDTPETFLFWDGIHPTAKGHALLGDLVTVALGFDLFADFNVTKVELEEDEFEVKGNFILGAASDGIDPLTEDVMLKVGAFATTIPAGSFTRTAGNRLVREFTFAGIIDEVALEVKIESLGRRVFKFEVRGEGVDLRGTSNPVGVTLTIGNDTGAGSATAE